MRRRHPRALDGKALDGCPTAPAAPCTDPQSTMRSEVVDPGEMGGLFSRGTHLFAAIDGAGDILHANPAWERILGWSPDDLVGRNVRDFVHPDDWAATERTLRGGGEGLGMAVGVENRYRTRTGDWRRLLWAGHWDGSTWLAIAQDVTDRTRHARAALRDDLTGLATRSAILDRLEHALALAQRGGTDVTVLFLDLDGFKGVNDSLGHATGDEVLREVGARLREAVRDSDTVGRLGGDEFVVVAENVGSAAGRRALVDRVRAAFAAPVVVARTSVRVGASIGVTVAQPGQVASEVLREADVAMYRAKATSHGGSVEVDDGLRREVRERVALGHELHGAADRGELVLHYQPQVTLSHRAVVGVEALVRWRHPERGLLPPGAFLGIAEDDDEIVVLGDWVLRTAIAQARRWRRQGHDIAMAVNVSPRQLADPGFPARLRGLLHRAHLPPATVCIEVTETAVSTDLPLIGDALTAVKDIGVRLALDDFGRGWSSLGHVKQLPIDVIKIDKGFVDGIAFEEEDRAVVAALVQLATRTGLDVVAEGVETAGQAHALAELGCDVVQGYHFGRPVPAADVPLGGFVPRGAPGVGDPLVIREFMRQIGIPARLT